MLNSLFLSELDAIISASDLMENPGQTWVFYKQAWTGQNVTQLTWMNRPSFNLKPVKCFQPQPC